MKKLLITGFCCVLLAGQVSIFTASAQLLTGVSQTWSGVGNAPNANPPQIEATLFGEEVFAFVDRTHELTSARYDPLTGLLNTANTGTLVGLPSYLLGAMYVANANGNRTAGDINVPDSYVVTYTVSGPAVAVLLIDNRMNGTTSAATGSPNTTDPDLGGSMSWVINDGWLRVNTGIMPNGQPDYLGIDEGGSVASPGLRTHHDPGAGQSLNQFYSVYWRYIPAAGDFVTRGIRQAGGSGNMYVVAVIPEPATWTLLALGGLGALCLRRRK